MLRGGRLERHIIPCDMCSSHLLGRLCLGLSFGDVFVCDVQCRLAITTGPRWLPLSLQQ